MSATVQLQFGVAARARQRPAAATLVARQIALRSGGRPVGGTARPRSERRLAAPARRAPVLRASALQEEEEGIVDVEGRVVDNRIPVTVITGFLGSGKTTLLNNLLKKNHGRRIAVIENEFGEVDIDSELVSVGEALDPKAEQILMLNNGCLCCTVRDDLVEMLLQLHERRDQFDRVVIETTGLADPAPIIQTFFLDPTVADKMRLDGVVTLVDAKHAEQHLDERKPKGVVNEAVEQIAFADRIVLNKTDLVDEEYLEELEERIRDINSMAQVVRAQLANVDVDYVLGVGGFDLERVEEQVLAEAEHEHEHDHDHDCAGAGCTHESHSHSHGHDGHSHSHDDHDGAGAGCTHESHGHHHHHHHHRHDDGVTSVSISLDGDMDLDKVNYWLGGLIEVKANDLYRMKGVLAIKDFERRFVFQGVHMLFEGMPDRLWGEGEKRTSKMVFIGRDLDEATIREGFAECLVREGA